MDICQTPLRKDVTNTDVRSFGRSKGRGWVSNLAKVSVAILCMGTGFNIALAHATPTLVQTDTGPELLYQSSAALLIGASNYQSSAGWDRLKSVPSDVANLSIALRAQGFDVKVIVDPKGDLRDDIKSFIASHRDPKGRLLIYFAGHGYIEPSTQYKSEIGYLVPVNAPNPNLESRRFHELALSMNEIHGLAEDIVARHALFVMDSCFSGSIFIARSFSGRPLGDVRLEQLEEHAIQFLTASDAMQETPAISKFTPAFIRGIKGDADVGNLGYVTFDQLSSWLKSQFASENSSPRSGYLEQTGGDMLFVYPAGRYIRARSAAPIPLPTAVRDARQPLIHKTPPQPSGDLFEGITVQYFQKVSDGKHVLNALERGHIPYYAHGTILADRFYTNSIACTADMNVKVVKSVTLALLRAGIPIKAIFRISPELRKKKTVQILSYTPDGQNIWRAPVLTEERVRAMSACPTLHVDQTSGVLMGEGI